jgi:hypothetical protein
MINNTIGLLINPRWFKIIILIRVLLELLRVQPIFLTFIQIINILRKYRACQDKFRQIISFYKLMPVFNYQASLVLLVWRVLLYNRQVQHSMFTAYMLVEMRQIQQIIMWLNYVFKQGQMSDKTSHSVVI